VRAFPKLARALATAYAGCDKLGNDENGMSIFFFLMRAGTSITDAFHAAPHIVAYSMEVGLCGSK
jgi:hypothetical protein